MIALDKIRKTVERNSIPWHKHALERMVERGISRDDAKGAVMQGDIIEYYPGDYPLPALLIHHSGRKALHVACCMLHVVLAYDEMDKVVNIVTVYQPDLAHFEEDLKTRRKQ